MLINKVILQQASIEMRRKNTKSQEACSREFNKDFMVLGVV